MDTTEGSRKDTRGRVRRTAEQRRELLRRYEASGLSKAEFCRRNEVNLGTFCPWVEAARRGKRAEAAGGAAEVRFAEVELALGGGSRAPIEIEVPGGVTIRVHERDRCGLEQTGERPWNWAASPTQRGRRPPKAEIDAGPIDAAGCRANPETSGVLGCASLRRIHKDPGGFRRESDLRGAGP